MTPGRLALDLWMAGVVLSLISIGLLTVCAALVSLLTVARAARRARRPRELGQLSRWYSMTELTEIDEALDRVLAEERGALPGRHG